MKYYCKDCGSELTTPFTENYMALCPHCVTDDGSHKIMECISNYETPTQYEVRTGKPYPYKWPVWVRSRQCENDEWEAWDVDLYNGKDYIFTKFNFIPVPCEIQIVVVSSSIPPPDDFISGETIVPKFLYRKSK